MKIIGVDLETYYDSDYSLSKLTTEQYVRDPRFEIIGVSVMCGQGSKPEWFSGTQAEITAFLDNKINWEEDAVLCHNAVFDGAILSWHLNRSPKLWLDTLSMARPRFLKTIGVSLAALAKHYKLGEKGLAVLDAKGKRRADFTTRELAAYGEYCCNDIELTFGILKELAPDHNTAELQVIDQTVRMFTEPKFLLNKGKLEEYLAEVRANKQRLLEEVGAENRDAFMSNDLFAQLLEAEGVDPPTKWSAKQNKKVYAFAKTDKGLKDLLDHESERVQALVACRLGVKTTIEETRTERLIGISERGLFPVMLNYWGAGTGRFSGGDKVNPQNFKRGGKIRDAIEALPGHQVIASDLSQIEARILALVAGQHDLVVVFSEKGDPYCVFATDVFGREVTKADKQERFLGKTCLAAGSQVLTNKGWRAIEEVRQDDLLWDGEEWVCHNGVVFNGMKKTLETCGLSLTPDHLVLCGTEWRQADSLVKDGSILSQALATGRASLKSLAMSLHHTEPLSHLLSSAPAPSTNTLWTSTTLRTSGPLDVIYVQKKQPLRNATGYMPKQCLMMDTELGYLIGSRLPKLDATIQTTEYMPHMEVEASMSMDRGEKTDRSSLDISRQYRGGTTQTLTWTEQIITKGTSQGTLGLFPSQRMLQIKGESTIYKQESQSLKPVYDIADAGPRNRFTVKVDGGAMVVHNCILGLGYMTGAKKLRETLRQGGLTITIEEAERIVKLYRKKYSQITRFWRTCSNALDHMVIGGSGYVSQEFNIRYEGSKVILPNGAVLRYPGLEKFKDPETGKAELRYLNRKKWTKIYGGLLCENIIQALARGVIAEYIVSVGERYGIALQVHDEIVCVVPSSLVEEALKFIQDTMSTVVSWLPGLPVECEIHAGGSYGECK